MCMDIQAITEMLNWVKPQAITRLVCLTDSIGTLAKIQNGMLLANWVAAINQSNLLCVQCFFFNFRSVEWFLCPGHAGVRRNERADALAG